MLLLPHRCEDPVPKRFPEGYARTVIVHIGIIGCIDSRTAVHELSRIFFHVNAGKPDAAFFTVYVNIHIAVQADRQIELRCLEIFR